MSPAKVSLGHFSPLGTLAVVEHSSIFWDRRHFSNYISNKKSYRCSLSLIIKTRILLTSVSFISFFIIINQDDIWEITTLDALQIFINHVLLVLITVLSEKFLLKDIIKRIKNFYDLFCIIRITSSEKMHISEFYSLTEKFFKKRPFVYIEIIFIISWSLLWLI